MCVVYCTTQMFCYFTAPALTRSYVAFCVYFVFCVVCVRTHWIKVFAFTQYKNSVFLVVVYYCFRIWLHDIIFYVTCERSWSRSRPTLEQVVFFFYLFDRDIFYWTKKTVQNTVLFSRIVRLFNHKKKRIYFKN